MIRLSFIGDVMCEYDRLNSYRDSEGMYDFSPLFAELKEEFQKSDLVIANLETPLAGEALKYSWKKYQFNTPDELGIGLKNAGIHMVTTANNHVLDRGVEGLKITLDTLDRIGLYHTGSARSKEEARPAILNIGKMKIGVISYTYGTEACYNNNYLEKGEEYRVNLLRNQELINPVRRFFHVSKRFFPRAVRAIYRRMLPKRASREVGERWESDRKQKIRLINDINYAKDNSDYVVLCLHCGGQYNEKPTVYTKKVVDFCLSRGVNAVIGNHEHRIQGSMLKNKDRIVTYCLGNFTGGAGVLRPPYDKNANCSILFNIYIDDNRKLVDRTSFEVLISVNCNGKLMTKNVFDEIKTTKSFPVEELYNKNLQAVNDFLGTDLKELDPKEEYFVDDFIR